MTVLPILRAQSRRGEHGNLYKLLSVHMKNARVETQAFCTKTQQAL